MGTVEPGALATLDGPLERDDFSSNRHPALCFCLSMIFFEKPVSTFPDHALAGAPPQQDVVAADEQIFPGEMPEFRGKLIS